MSKQCEHSFLELTNTGRRSALPSRNFNYRQYSRDPGRVSLNRRETIKKVAESNLRLSFVRDSCFLLPIEAPTTRKSNKPISNTTERPRLKFGEFRASQVKDLQKPRLKRRRVQVRFPTEGEECLDVSQIRAAIGRIVLNSKSQNRQQAISILGSPQCNRRYQGKGDCQWEPAGVLTDHGRETQQYYSIKKYFQQKYFS